MQPRPVRSGVTLPEVLVASVLLAVGVSGCISALTTAMRLRTGAATREGMSSAAHDRLTWFETQGCVAGDTLIAGPVGAVGTERWQLTRAPGESRLAGEMRAARAGLSFGFSIETRRSCE